MLALSIICAAFGLLSTLVTVIFWKENNQQDKFIYRQEREHQARILELWEKSEQQLMLHRTEIQEIMEFHRREREELLNRLMSRNLDHYRNEPVAAGGQSIFSPPDINPDLDSGEVIADFSEDLKWLGVEENS